MDMWGHLYRSLPSTMFWKVMVSLKTSQGLLWKLGWISVQKYENVALCSWLRRKDKSYGDSTSLHPAAAGHWIGTEGNELLLEVRQLSLPMLLKSTCCFFKGHYYSASTFTITSLNTISGSLHLLHFLFVLNLGSVFFKPRARLEAVLCMPDLLSSCETVYTYYWGQIYWSQNARRA